MAEEGEHLVPDPLRRRLATWPQAIVAVDDHILDRRGRTVLALWWRDESHPQRLGQVPDAGEKPRGMGGTLELQTGEVIVMHPLVQQRFQEDFGREYLLPNGSQVVDANRAALGPRLPGDSVIAVGFHLEFSSAGAVPLRPIDDGQLAGWEAGSLIEHIEESLTFFLTAGG